MMRSPGWRALLIPLSGSDVWGLDTVFMQWMEEEEEEEQEEEDDEEG